MPVLNELDYLETAVASVLQQEVPGASELILALGPSSDGTTELAERIAAADPRVRVVYNPQAHIPVGLNLAIRASKHPIIVRVDAHSELAPGYTVQAIETLHRTGAANVGGIMHAQGRNPFQRAAAWAYNSRVGLGGGAYHGGDEEQEAESAYLGVMRREAIESVGLFDESVRRGEDWELNLRLRQAGFRVWFDPALSVTYWPRESPLRLARQFRATGTWRGELVRRYGRSNSIRFFAPPLLFVALIIAVAVAIAQMTGLFSGPWLLWSSIVYVPLALYVLLIAATACVPDAGAHAVRRGLRGRLWTLAVLPTMHLSWGCGFLIGVMHGAHDTVDASRLGTRNTPLP
ncbi:glycosyltransferase family 2 protein [Microbacterium sp. YY-01]|uniref:glycosyltransferase family 2 protein n=1 Tax=Microbacterium sp. YY-01 TaxID=3421634 RepID=UPI003D164B99